MGRRSRQTQTTECLGWGLALLLILLLMRTRGPAGGNSNMWIASIHLGTQIKFLALALAWSSFSCWEYTRINKRLGKRFLSFCFYLSNI